VIEHLLCKLKALSSNSNPIKEKEKEKEREREKEKFEYHRKLELSVTTSLSCETWPKHLTFRPSVFSSVKLGMRVLSVGLFAKIQQVTLCKKTLNACRKRLRSFGVHYPAHIYICIFFQLCRYSLKLKTI
jgi:hypothetical protein